MVSDLSAVECRACGEIMGYVNSDQVVRTEFACRCGEYGCKSHYAPKGWTKATRVAAYQRLLEIFPLGGR
ncbi:hypothetical protein PBI_MIAZEAL_8 [Mycobacterium phage MiaZeal]|uniref:hypothetical protein n=1 Tax=Mycobacterium phage MiaZeal TaxID=1567005 RepID=UPI000540B355|nr:hypothetical protein AVV70_gp008 [Mycobacterium phage MiaZeal]AIY32362.1 hypothetical protein PBI_MIAZEAL_8 [Mycobacterium phage MiaZeal]